jgi:glycosyltransferase involved in cell wall biosynthesis
MKIGYVSTYLPQQCGIATYTDYLLKGIVETSEKASVRVICERGAREFRSERVQAIPCWQRDENYVEPILEHARDLDVVHIQHEYSIYKFDERLPALLSALAGRTRSIITIHCVRPRQFSDVEAIEDFTREIAHRSDKVIVHLHSARDILSRLSVPEQKMTVIPHGTELSDVEKNVARERLRLPQNSQILVMFGFVKPHKCAHIALEAVKELTKEIPNVYFFMAGGLAPTASEKDREHVQYLKSRIQELNIADRVIFPERFFPNEDVPYILGAADIILFPYYEEDRSSSGSLHLSIGAKRGVIASRIPKFADLGEVCDELLVLPHNSSAVAEVALRLFRDTEFREYVMERVDAYRRQTSWVATAAKHLELYKN